MRSSSESVRFWIDLGLWLVLIRTFLVRISSMAGVEARAAGSWRADATTFTGATSLNLKGSSAVPTP